MELRAYWHIIVRRWPVVVGLTLLALVFSIVTVVAVPQQGQSYQATIRLAVRPAATSSWSLGDYGEYYKYVASEYLNDDIVEIMESQAFMQSVQESLAQQPEGRPNGTIKAMKAHRVLILTVDSDRAGDALRIAEAIDDHIAPYFEILTEQDPVITIVDPPSLTVLEAGRRGAMDLALRTLLGLFVGLALVFLLDYLDDTVRDGNDASRATGLPLLGELPAERRSLRQSRRARRIERVPTPLG